MNDNMTESSLVSALEQALAATLTFDSLVGVGLILVVGCVAFFFARTVRGRFEARQYAWASGRVGNLFGLVWFPLTWLLLLATTYGACSILGVSEAPLGITLKLLFAWVVIRLVSGSLGVTVWTRVAAFAIWGYAALSITGLQAPVQEMLRQASFGIGQVTISALGVIEGLVTLAALVWTSVFFMHFVEGRISVVSSLTPSVRVLIAKVLRIVLITAAFLITLSVVGVDLTALAVFGGAIGVGLGFGLQKIFSNLVSGFILLLDKSIKPGDVIAGANYYGRVDSLGARYVSIYTRDGIEHLIPNEDLITNPVENWSYSQNLLRLRVSVGVHYKSDVHLARSLCLQAASATPRVLEDPKPNCLMRAFGDSSVDMEIRFWINDPMNGRANVTSDLLFNVWDLFHEHDIESPYPQRDLHLRSISTDVAAQIVPNS